MWCQNEKDLGGSRISLVGSDGEQQSKGNLTGVTEEVSYFVDYPVDIVVCGASIGFRCGRGWHLPDST